MSKQTIIDDVNCKMCKSCMFHRNEHSIKLGEGRLAEIEDMLLNGTNQICHTTEKICRGGREYQLDLFHKMGIIAEPTDEALYEAMERAGVKPNKAK